MSQKIDLTNLVRGEGEFQNIQEIVRRTLLTCFEQIDKQGAQISQLVGHVGSLKAQLAKKASRDEVPALAGVGLMSQIDRRADE
ncbi:hypothetical protein B484DRAFT_425890, partial [Ochromonadaceae sp. CCMP2298]